MKAAPDAGAAVTKSAPKLGVAPSPSSKPAPAETAPTKTATAKAAPAKSAEPAKSVPKAVETPKRADTHAAAKPLLSAKAVGAAPKAATSPVADTKGPAVKPAEVEASEKAASAVPKGEAQPNPREPAAAANTAAGKVAATVAKPKPVAAAASKPAPQAAAPARTALPPLKVVGKPAAARPDPVAGAAKAAKPVAGKVTSRASVSPGAIPAKAANDTSEPARNGAGYAGFGGATASLGEINEAVLSFLRGEGEAALAHARALAQVRSAGDLFRLQAAEFQRAADASMTCLGSILRSAGRFGGAQRS